MGILLREKTACDDEICKLSNTMESMKHLLSEKNQSFDILLEEHKKLADLLDLNNNKIDLLEKENFNVNRQLLELKNSTSLVIGELERKLVENQNHIAKLQTKNLALTEEVSK